MTVADSAASRDVTTFSPLPLAGEGREGEPSGKRGRIPSRGDRKRGPEKSQIAAAVPPPAPLGPAAQAPLPPPQAGEGDRGRTSIRGTRSTHDSGQAAARSLLSPLPLAGEGREGAPPRARPGRPQLDLAKLKASLIADAKAEGFDVVRVTAPDATADAAPHLAEFIAAGRYGTMDWLAETAERRADPKRLWRAVRTVIMLGLNYAPDTDPLETLARRDRATISVYARNRDYHAIVKGRLKGLADRLGSRAGSSARVFVDTAPVMEKPLAAAAGIGWQGKHTNLVSRDFGSWLFLGTIFTDLDLPLDSPETDHCGTCRACLDVCPTSAFPAPYQLDARRCISYLTIEHDGPIPHEFRKAIGNRVYGCDDCLAVCPWNKFAAAGREAKLAAREDLRAPPLADLARLDDASFRGFFSASPIKRIGRDRFIRNVLIAIGNSGDPALAPEAERLRADPDPVVAEAADWALSELAKARSAKGELA